MKGKKKQYIVMGLGSFGASVARNLCRLGHEVLAVDRNETLVNAVAPHVTQAIQADAADEAALRELDVGSFDAAVIAIGTDTRASILVTVLCKEAGVPMVIAKAVDDLHAKVLEKVGADRVVFPERDMGMRVARSLDSPNMQELLELSDGDRIAEIIVPQRWVGHTLAELNIRRRHGISVLGVNRNGKFNASPDADSEFLQGDVLLVLGKEWDIEAID